MPFQVIDASGSLGQFEDVSKVEKFELTQDEYDKRADSVKAFKERMKIGRFADLDPEEQKKIEEEKLKKIHDEEERAKAMAMGQR